MTFLDTLNDALFWIGVYVLGWYAVILICNKAIPNIKTAPAIRKVVFEHLKQDIKHKKNYTVIDLGCADGTFARHLARTIPNINIIGIDVSALDILKARTLNRLFGFKNITYIKKDFMSYDLSQADAICIFLMPHVMQSLRSKLEKELKTGTLVTSNRFAIGGDWKPDKTIDIDTLAVNQKQLYIYRV